MFPSRTRQAGEGGVEVNVSIAEAARLVNRDRKTLYNALHTGRLSATVGKTGIKQVDTAELERVYGPLRLPDSTIRVCGVAVEIPQVETPNETPLVERLKAEIEHLRARLADKERHLEDKDKHLDDMRRTLLLLENKSRRRWWPF